MTTTTFKKRLFKGVVASAALALASVVARRWLEASDIHLVPRTAFGPCAVYNVEWDDGEPVRVLNVCGSIQSATYLDERYCEPVFPYYRLYDLAFEAGLPVRNVCMVGGGGYAYPKHLLSTRPEARIDVVEIDPVVTSLAQRYFFLDRLVVEYDLEDEETGETPRLGLIEQDGRMYLEEYAVNASRPRYDAVMNDCFSAGKPAASLATAEAARAAHACLVPGGVYLTNVVGALRGPDSHFLRAQAATLAQAFAHVYAVPCSQTVPTEADNVMLVACDAPCSFDRGVEILPHECDVVLTDACCPIQDLVK